MGTGGRYELSKEETECLRGLSRGVEASLEEVRAELGRARERNTRALEALCSAGGSEPPLPQPAPDIEALEAAERGFRESWEEILAALLGLEGPVGEVVPRIRRAFQRRQKKWRARYCPPSEARGPEAP